MPNNAYVETKEDVDMQVLMDKLSEFFKEGGYTTRLSTSDDVYKLHVEKNMNGFMKYVGLGENIDAHIRKKGNSIDITFLNQEFLFHALVIFIGLFVTCGILAVPGGIGLFNDLELPKKIEGAVRSMV